MDLLPAQRKVVRSPLEEKKFLSGPVGCGKTTTGADRMIHLLDQGIPADSLLVLSPQRTLLEPYRLKLQERQQAGGEIAFSTIGGLARRMMDLFWPLVAEPAGYAHPDRPPVFLTLETAQYYMAHIVRPLLEDGYFDSITINRSRLYSQIIDNLNKAASNGFDYREIGDRLTAAWSGDLVQHRVYTDVQDCATRFRQYCLEHNLVDFSLQIECFWNFLWPDPIVHTFMVSSYQHLIYDNVEEDIPRAHDLIRQWLPELRSALLIFDEGGGHRRFLGADPESGWSLRDLCSEHVALQVSFITSDSISQLEKRIYKTILPEEKDDKVVKEVSNQGKDSELVIRNSHFYPELLDHIVADVHYLLNIECLPPSEIVILAPYLSDALRFSLTNRLDARNIPWRSHRPSRSLRDEAASQALLTLSALAHPHWKIEPARFDVAYALTQAVEGLDLIRAQLLTSIVYRQRDCSLASFDGIKVDVQNRITYSVGNRFTLLRDWLLAYQAGQPLPMDHFLRKLFSEVLSLSGFRFHTRFDSVRVASSLIESVQKFRQGTEAAFVAEGIDPGLEYLAMLQDGVIAAQYLESWRTEQEDAVLISPAHTFLMMNHPATVQIWLDAGSSGWSERLSQPLTHPYVLSRHWERDRIWTDADEVKSATQALAQLVSGLLFRCRGTIYLTYSDLGESGYEQRGVLLRAFQKIDHQAISDAQD